MIRPEQERVRKLLTEAVTLLCRNSLQFEEEVCVEGLLGITLDKRDILLVSIRETVQQTFREVSANSARAEKELPPPGSPGKRKKRRRSKDSDCDSQPAPQTPPVKRSAPSPVADPDSDDTRPDPEARLSISQVKKEIPDDQVDGDGNDEDGDEDKNENDTDGRSIHPAHDSSSRNRTGSSGESPPPELKQELPSSAQSSHSSPHPAPHEHSEPQAGVKIKEEVEDDIDECFVIDSDNEDMSVMSDNSQSNPVPLNILENQLQMAAQNWPTVDGSNAFNLGDLAQSNLSQTWANQSFDMSGQALAGNSSFMGGPSPGTSQDGQRALLKKQCPACGKWVSKLKRHYDEMHLKVTSCVCPYCCNAYTRRRGLVRHIQVSHPGHAIPEVQPKAAPWQGKIGIE